MKGDPAGLLVNVCGLLQLGVTIRCLRPHASR
jgi:hypothetical protein